VPGTIVFDWINGSKFLVRNGETGLTGNIYTGLHEFSDMAFLLHYLNKDDLFVDVGANVGSYTILACSAIGAKGIAFEPVPSTYKRLIDNIHINHIAEKVVCINKGVGSDKGTIKFTSGNDTMNHAVATGELCNDSISVDIISLNTALNGMSPSFLKIDVEGMEKPVIDGAHEILKNKSLNCILMELNGSGGRYGYNEEQILNALMDHGFKTYQYDPFSRNLIHLNGGKSNSGNTLFVRDERIAKDRLKKAALITINGVRF
jgi:FkbM family methyltransferase